MEQRSPPEKIHVIPRTNQVSCKLMKDLLKPCQIREIVGAVKRKSFYCEAHNKFVRIIPSYDNTYRH